MKNETESRAGEFFDRPEGSRVGNKDAKTQRREVSNGWKLFFQGLELFGLNVPRVGKQLVSLFASLRVAIPYGHCFRKLKPVSLWSARGQHSLCGALLLLMGSGS